MTMRHKRNINTKGLESEEEQRNLLCRNKGIDRCSSLNFIKPNSDFITEEAAIEYLADILVDIFLAQDLYGEQTSSDLLPSINKRTS
jgi:hypothetical protein